MITFQLVFEGVTLTITIKFLNIWIPEIITLNCP